MLCGSYTKSKKKGGDFVDFIRQWKEFENRSAGNIPPNAVNIYLRLFAIDNSLGWPEWFEVSDYFLLSATCIKRRETIVAALNVLKQKGFIDYERGGKHKASRYKIIALIDSALDSANNSAIDSAITSSITSAIDSASLEKPPIKRENVNVNVNVNNTRTGAKKKFVPPTLDDVNAYVMEKGLHVSAKEFFDYFDAGNWVDSKGQKVQNWKQKMLTWEKYHKQEKQGTNSTRADIADRAIAMAESLQERSSAW